MKFLIIQFYKEISVVIVVVTLIHPRLEDNFSIARQKLNPGLYTRNAITYFRLREL
jgi:hypothetical protein